jgi:hypothetical protein
VSADAFGPAWVHAVVRLPMRIYIRDAQIPELAGFPPASRRALRHLAFQQMFAQTPLLRWVPNGLCGVGAVLGVFTFGALPGSLYTSLYTAAGEPMCMFIPTAYILVLAALGGFIGAQWLTHHARRYLRHLILSDGHRTQPAA